MTDATTPLEQQLDTTKQEVFSALTTSNFYIELIFIAVALALALGVANLLKRYCAARLRQNYESKPYTPWLLRTLTTLYPLFVIFYLGVAEPFATQYAGQSSLTVTLNKLAITWLGINAVFLLVRNRAFAWFISIVMAVLAVLNATGFAPAIATFLDSLSVKIGKYEISMLGFVHGIIIFVIVFWVAGTLKHMLEIQLKRVHDLSYNTRELILKFFTVFIYFLAFVVTLGAMGVDLTALAVFGGALGVGIGLGLQKITSNFVSGITLLVEKSIKIGDLIEIGTHMGWVRQLHMRYALIETFDGRELLVPNEELISNKVTNWTYSSDKARIDIMVGIAYDSDPDLARKLMLEACSEHPLCLRDPLPNCFLREFGDISMKFLLNFWIPDVKEGRFKPQSEVMLAILQKFKASDIHIAHPTQEIVLKRGE